MKRKPLILLAVVTVALAPLLFQGISSTARSDTTFDSPVPTPPLPPTPTPLPPSAEAQKALLYVSEREGIPTEGLLIINDYERAFPLIGRAFRAVTILDIRTTEGQAYSVLVDLVDGHIEEDVNGVEAAEEAAYQARYGKFHPSLYERLQKVGDDDLLPVAIWVAGDAKVRTREEVFAELAARYPEVATAMEHGRKPFEVDDPALAQEIRGEYRRMLAEDTAVRVGSLMDHLSQHGFEVRTYGAMPSVTAVLPKKVIEELAERDDVGLIYLIEEQVSFSTDTAVPTDRALAGWERTFSGWGGLVAAAVLWGLALPLVYLLWRADRPIGKKLLWVVLVTAMVLTLPLLYLAACQPRENELSFEAVERRDWPGSGREWEAREPGLMVIATSEDLAQIDDLFTEDAQAQLCEVDFNVYFAVAAFLGWQGSGHEGIWIEQVARRGEGVAVHVRVGKPGWTSEVTSPYHLVKVRKEGDWNRNIRFTLYLDGTAATSLSHFIP